MANKKNNKKNKEVQNFAEETTSFEKDRASIITQMYSDEAAAANLLNNLSYSSAGTFATAKDIRNELNKSVISAKKIIEYSKKMYASNPIYTSLIGYFSNMFLWRYIVIPHELPSKLLKIKPESTFKVSKKSYEETYNTMLEIVEGINFEAKAPLILTKLFVEGSCFFSAYCDEESMTINTVLYPAQYCRKVGETQFGTAVIQLDYDYFNNVGATSDEQLQQFLESFPKEIQEGYKKFLTDDTLRWQTLDPRYSSCIMLNEKGLPSFVYSLGSILDYEKYEDNELQKSNNLLRYIVTHKLPVYQDSLIFEMDEVKALHKGLAKIVNTNKDVRLMTTYGDIDIKKIQDNDKAENKTLEKAYDSIFNNAGLNATVFTGESVEAIKYSLLRDKALVWKFVEQLVNFYNVAVNNWFDFGDFQADIQILPISQYSYADDIEHYRENATLGVGKLDYIVASGVKQKNIGDRFALEKFLKLDKITPLQSSYTQSGKADSKAAPKDADEDEANKPSPKTTEVEDKEQGEVRGKDEEK